MHHPGRRFAGAYGSPAAETRTRPSKTNLLPTPSPVCTSPEDDGVPPELHCKICSKVMTDAVVASKCCFGSFCDVCIRGQIAANSMCVCGAPSRADDLIPNLTLRATIAKLLAAGSGSAGTSNRKSSSAGSNAEPTSQSAAASREISRSHVVTATAGSEHSEGSTSSTTSKSAAPPAASREPRMKRMTTAESSAETGAHAGYPEQYGYMNPFGPACYDPFFGATPWGCDPYMYYGGGMPYSGGYTNVPVPVGYHGGRKRMADGEFQRHAEDGFKRRRGGRSEVAF